MAKITIPDVSSGYNLSALNAAFQIIEDELNGKVLYRDNPVGEPNSMQNDLDLNSNDLLNVNAAQVQTITVGGTDLTDHVVAYTGYAKEWANKAEDSLISTSAGGDGIDDYSSLHWAEKSRGWAITPEDTLVEGVDYSAKHYAAKAAEYYGILPSKSLTTYEYTASTSQTVFSGLDDNGLTLAYSTGNILVLVNGSGIDSSEYTAIDGTSVTLATGAVAGDIVSILAFSSITLSSHYTKAESDAFFATTEQVDGTTPITPDINGGTLSGATVDGNLIANSETISPAQVGYLNDVTSNIQAQINNTAGKKRALVYASADQLSLTGVSDIVYFDSEAYDTSSIHEPAINPERLSVPLGVTKVRLTALILFEGNSTGVRRAIINRLGSTGVGFTVSQVNATTAPYFSTLSLVSPILDVSYGDSFYITAEQNSGGNLNILGGVNGSWFAMEVIE